MLNRSICIFVVALTTLLSELVLTRVFDVILQPNLAYMVITIALFSFGLAGVYTTLKPIQEDTDTNGDFGGEDQPAAFEIQEQFLMVGFATTTSSLLCHAAKTK